MFLGHSETVGIIAQKPRTMEPDVGIIFGQLVMLKSQEAKGFL